MKENLKYKLNKENCGEKKENNIKILNINN